MVNDCVAVTGWPVSVLVTCTAKVDAPTAVGVPDRIPPADNVTSAGRVPEASENV
jgi:hypothetical protein